LRTVGSEGGHRLGEDEAGPEQPRLLEGAEGQIITANPVRESGIVTDQGAGPRLSAEDLRLQHQRRQPFRGRRDSRGEPGRAGPDDGHVVAGGRGADGCPQERSELGVGGVDQHLAGAEDHHRQAAAVLASLAQELPSSLRIVGIEPVGHGDAGQDITQLM
jgi:hypothetical protein